METQRGALRAGSMVQREILHSTRGSGIEMWTCDNKLKQCSAQYEGELTLGWHKVPFDVLKWEHRI